MNFTKIHGTGNDFIIIDNSYLGANKEKLSYIAKTICRRKLSIGADGLIVIENSTTNADFKIYFLNSDGSFAEMCGNGARCAARYAFENKRAWDKMIIETDAGDVYAYRIDNTKYKIKLAKPCNIQINEKININSLEYKYSYVDIGNPGVPHVVLMYKDLYNENISFLKDIAKVLRNNILFYKGCNVTFYDIIEDNKYYIKTFERGVEDFTLSCGTGACATAFVLYINKECNVPYVNILTDGGQLEIELDINDDLNIKDIFLIGNTNIVAKGKVLDQDL